MFLLVYTVVLQARQHVGIGAYLQFDRPTFNLRLSVRRKIRIATVTYIHRPRFRCL